MSYKSFEDLDVWKRACRLATSIYKHLQGCKDHGLRNQMTRSAVSIASNIAEGAERNSALEFKRFLHIAKGSSAELRTQLYIANRIGLLEKKVTAELVEETKALSAKLQTLVNSLKT